MPQLQGRLIEKPGPIPPRRRKLTSQLALDLQRLRPGQAMAYTPDPGAPLEKSLGRINSTTSSLKSAERRYTVRVVQDAHPDHPEIWVWCVANASPRVAPTPEEAPASTTWPIPREAEVFNATAQDTALQPPLAQDPSQASPATKPPRRRRRAAVAPRGERTGYAIPPADDPMKWPYEMHTAVYEVREQSCGLCRMKVPLLLPELKEHIMDRSKGSKAPCKWTGTGDGA